MVYYNEIDPFAAAWLCELIKAGMIADGIVDERSIEDVKPSDLDGFTQCHFFAGIGVWSYSLRCAGWPDDRPIWTGSCPCQPFSTAGKGKGFADERHLWPAFFHLISQCHPNIVIGEQVASKDGLAWLDIVQSDVEAVGYACGAVDTCAAGFGAPHIRQRLYWVAYSTGDTGNERYKLESHGWKDLPEQTGLGSGTIGMENSERFRRRGGSLGDDARQTGKVQATGYGAAFRMAGASAREHKRCGLGYGKMDGTSEAYGLSENVTGCGTTLRVAHANNTRPQGRDGNSECANQCAPGQNGMVSARPGPTNGFWRDADWLFCRDGKWRPVEPGTTPLANGIAARVGRLRGYGNAINAKQAQAFIEAVIGII